MRRMTSLAVAAVVCALLLGCSSSASKREASVPSRSVEPRQIHITLVGGSGLNASASGQPRPVQTCVYVVRAADWLPSANPDDSSCAPRDKDSTIVADSRHVVAPNQVVQFMLELPRSGEIWLVTDADYAQRPASYAPLRMHIDGGDMIHVALWLDRAGIFNARRAGPVPVHADQADTAAGDEDALKPLKPPRAASLHSASQTTAR
jgi:type VI secretion system protein VasD